MEVKSYHKYKIKLEHRSVASIESDGRKLRSFIEPDNRDDLPKLYVVKSRAEVVYIGQTTQNIRTRLRQGLKAQGKTGYYGYMWKDLPEVGVLIWCFPGEDEKYAETIEGELVFLFRKSKGKWPDYQTEIHFHNPKRDEIRIAEAVLKECLR